MIMITLLSAVSAVSVQPYASTHIISTEAHFTYKGGGDLDIEFSVIGTRTMIDVGASTITVYNSKGTQVARFTPSSYPNMMGSNSVAHGGVVTFSGTPGQMYYAEVEFYARDSRGSDTVTYLVDSMTA